MALRLRLLLVVAVVAWSFRPGVAYPPAVSVLPGLPVAGLAVGFYNASCPQVEDLVLAEMRAIVEKDWTLGPALLRFMFHDCLVRGCDASIMLISRNGTGERDAAPSYGLRGYDEIEHIKAKVEEACPLTVSCADIIAIAARDAVHLSNGPRYPVETGRRDGKGSAMCDADNDLPPPFSNIVDLKTYFSVKGLGWKDLVVLSGSHTIGRAQCSTFASDRLYNYSGDGGQDPSLDKAYAATLREACEAGLSNDVHGPGHPPHLRPGLLPRRAQPQGALPLRPGAHGRPVDQGVRGADGRRRVAGRVLRRLRARHDQHGQDRGAHGRQRGDQEGLRRAR